MTDQTLSNRLRESVKLGILRSLQRADLDVARDPYVTRLVRTLQHAGIDTVLDVGANVGQFAWTLRRAGFTGEIVSVEPLSSAYAQLSRRVARDPRWQSINRAVGAEPGTTEINVSANSYSSSLLPMTKVHLDAAPGSSVIGTQPVEVVTVVDLVDRFGIDPTRTLLKVDTQGFEKPVMDGTGDLLDQFAAVQLELSFVQLYEGQVLFHDLVSQLRERDLHLWSLETGMSAENGRLLYCDGLFLRGAAPEQPGRAL